MINEEQMNEIIKNFDGGYIEFNNMLRTHSVGEKIEAFMKLFRKKIQDCDEIEEHFMNSNTVINIKEEVLTVIKEETKNFKNNLDILKELIRISMESKFLPIKKDETYVITNWDSAYCAGTGEFVGGSIKSKKAKVIENSRLSNGYQSFILEITRYPFIKDEDEVPYILVQPSYGKWKSPVLVRLDSLIIK